ncbi:MAG: hypothetical protein JXQ65_07175 [Candidatus Marinimicrobia bacterium]|nr:hypothetical protein [Candidatus Neomarinimicrobiota bacterium]
MIQAPLLYQKYYIDRDYEQIDLFQMLSNQFDIKSAIYPGSFIHISPSSIFPVTCYIDADKNAKQFFATEKYLEYIRQRKQYEEEPVIRFYGENYTQLIQELIGKFDLMISQYAGYISGPCFDYLKPKGLLLVNNSHADAGLTILDNRYKLIAAIHKSNRKYSISYSSLDQYFIPKNKIANIKDHLIKTGKGIGYTKTAPLYLFEKIKG